MIDKKDERCPVCGMKTEVGDYKVEYHKLFFYFCSAQCRETFQSHPGLYTGVHAHECGEVIKTRKLRLAKTLDADTAQAINEYLRVLMGIKESQAEGRRLTIQYDLLQLTLTQIEKALNYVDIQMDQSWWQRLRRDMVKSTEENELDNLAAPQGACCNRPPPGA